MDKFIYKSHSIKLCPTSNQKALLDKAFGCARHSFNWGLNKWKELYEAGEKPSAYSLIKLQNSIKRTEMPFYLEVNKCAVQYAIHDLESAFKKMWKEGAGYPKFKKKGYKDSFVAVENGKYFKQSSKKIWVPRVGWMKCTEDFRFKGSHVVNMVVSKKVDMYFASITVRIEKENTNDLCDNQTPIGIDVGIKTMLTLSNGCVYKNPTFIKTEEKRLKRYQKSLSRKKLGSSNYKKAKLKLARKHYKIACTRKAYIHKVTSDICKKYTCVVVESLKPSEMLITKSLSKAVMDVSLGEILKQLNYKFEWAGKQLINADRWYPSSKICSACGNRKTALTLTQRVYNCTHCGLHMDRDLNAAKNLAKYSPTLKHKESKACGEQLLEAGNKIIKLNLKNYKLG